MGRQCERCRRDISAGGVHYNGHEYCMTCYQFLKGADDRRMADAARKKEEEARKRRAEALKKRDEEKLLKKASYVREAQQASAREDALKRKKESEARQQALAKKQKSYPSGASGAAGAAQTQELYSPLLARQGARKQGAAPTAPGARRDIAIGKLVSGLGKGPAKKKEPSPLAEESKKRVSDYLALTLEQEELAAQGADAQRKSKEYKAKLEGQLKEERMQVSQKYEKLEAELSKRADSLGAEEFSRQMDALEAQKAEELGKIEKWYSEKTGTEDKKIADMKKANSLKISQIEKKKKEIESQINKKIALNIAAESLPAIAEKELIEQIQKHASAAAKSLVSKQEEEGGEEGGKEKEKEEAGKEAGVAEGEMEPDFSGRIEQEMARQAALEIDSLLGKAKAAGLMKKDLNSIYMSLLEGEYEKKQEEYQGSSESPQDEPVAGSACPACGAPIGKSDKFCKKCGKPYANVESLHLEIQQGLPVSLSQGQRDISCVLLATNPAGKPASCDLQATLMDSKKNMLKIELDPASASIAAASKSGFEIRFSLAEGVPKGALMLSAVLNSPAGQSNSVSSVSNVKSPMDLAYSKGSAGLGGKLENFISLGFDNIGESGGMVMPGSLVEFEDENGNRKAGKLSGPVKFKGLEKGVALLFGPLAMGQKFSKLTYLLVGVDSNGKPYKKEGKV